MRKIGLLSDTHGYFDPVLADILGQVDEIWHAGDIGSAEVLEKLDALGKSIYAVSGNIDGTAVRTRVPEEITWSVEGKKIWMIHIGGYPGHYPVRIQKRLEEIRPDIFVCGHSHILKVIHDKELNLLHLNPGASGKEGFHQIRTMLRFTIDGDMIADMAVVELGLRV